MGMDEDEALRWAAELDAEERAKKEKQQVMAMAQHSTHHAAQRDRQTQRGGGNCCSLIPSTQRSTARHSTAWERDTEAAGRAAYLQRGPGPGWTVCDTHSERYSPAVSFPYCNAS